MNEEFNEIQAAAYFGYWSDAANLVVKHNLNASQLISLYRDAAKRDGAMFEPLGIAILVEMACKIREEEK